MQTKRGKESAAHIAENAAPMLLSTAVVSFIAYIYAGGSASATFLFVLVSLLYSAGLFEVYELLRQKGKTLITSLCVLGIVIVSCYTASAVTDMKALNDMGLWFMEPSRFSQVYYGNTVALILVIGFVLISSLYYFTRVRRRSVFVFLICLCPFCLFAKTFTDIPVICPIIIMTLFFFIMTGQGCSTDRTPGSRAGITAALAFILSVTVIASFFPKLDSAPFREDFDEFITGVNIGAAAGADYSQFTDTSSSGTTSPDDDKIVFSFFGDCPGYIKRQCFNRYDLATNTWGYYGDEQTGNNDRNKFLAFEDPSVLYSAAGSGKCKATRRKCVIEPESGHIRALYTHDRMTSIELGKTDLKIYRTELDEYFVERSGSDGIRSYIIEWTETETDPAYSDAFSDELAEELSGSSDSDIRLAAASYIRAKDQAVKYNAVLLSDTTLDKCYSSINARLQVKELAERITSGCDSPLDKANALVSFFRKGDYIYDKNFTSPDGSPDTFIFGTRRGACGAYATAMTLMCRELGLTARYCEGFMVDEFNKESGRWIARTGDAHAFVQVWINGYGWTTFDPTSSVTDGGFFDMTFVWVGGAAAVLILIGAVTVMLRPKLEEAAFVRRISRTRGAAQYSLVYCRINAKINSWLGEKTNRFTPTDTARECIEIFGYDISGFVQDYENAVYGGIGAENGDRSDIYTGFMTAYRAKLRANRRKNRR